MFICIYYYIIWFGAFDVIVGTQKYKSHVNRSDTHEQMAEPNKILLL